jgi:hypothetical protein
MAINKRVSLQTSNTSTSTQSEALLERFKTLYREMNASDLKLDLLKQVYAEDMVFHDSFHHIQGRENFIAYCENLYENLQRCDFEFHEQWLSESQAMLTWTMVYQHPKLNRGKAISVEGATHIRFDEQINFHQDYCDGGALLYEHVPVLGSIIQQLKKRLA